MTYRLGVDIGGTFTDFALFDEAGSEIAVSKRLTTPADPSVAVLEGAAALLHRENVSMTEVESIAHGTTLVTNSVIERNGAKTGMLVTAGFRDILDMGFEQRYDLFDLRLTWPDPLVPRRLRREVRERVAYDGRVVEPLDPDGARDAVRGLVETAGIEALAICFLHSYANPVHEEAAGDLVREEFPGLHVSRSAEVFGNMREYERWTTATMNAYAQPMFDRYIERLEGGLSELGFTGRLHIMTSSGASIVPETARRFPVRALESGPAAGALMSAHHGRSLGLPDLLSFDMGGTTAKGALVRGFAPLKQYDLEVGRVHDFKRGSGLPVKLPVIDMIEIGSGGGSLARVDERGLVRVGPRSAGADPGPACYGKGGTGATLTDADVVLGYLDPEFFLGGEMRLDAGAARTAIEQHVAQPAGLDPIRAGISNPLISTRLDMRYQGQGYEIEVTLPDGGAGGGQAGSFARLEALFRAKYAEIFAETFLDEPLEIVSWKVEAAGSEAALAYRGIAGGTRRRAKHAREVWFGDRFLESPVLDRYGLAAGTTIEGPAVIEERESTCVLGPGDRATVDERLNLVAELANDGSDS